MKHEQKINQRLLSIDVLRGMTIFLMILVNSPGSWSYVYAPLLHAKWHGCTPTDLVFPFFIFTMGLSMAFSFSKNGTQRKSQVLTKILKRTFAIFLVGLLLNWFPFYTTNILDLRFFGVLQRIALSFGFAAIIVLYIPKIKWLLTLVILGLISYSLILTYGGNFTLEGNLNQVVDSIFLPTKNVYQGFGVPFDPEGLLGVFSSSLHVIIGYLIGSILKKHRNTPMEFVKMVIPIGVILALLAYFLLDPIDPINKPLWTSSYVVYTSGLACILLASLVYILDVKKLQKWSFPFKVFGRNALISYVSSGIIVNILLYVLKNNNGNAYQYLFKNVYQSLLGDYNGSLAFALSIVASVYLIAIILYRKNIVIKL